MVTQQEDGHTKHQGDRQHNMKARRSRLPYSNKVVLTMEKAHTQATADAMPLCNRYSTCDTVIDT